MQQCSSRSLRSRRARCTRDFIPETEMPELVGGSLLGLATDVHAHQGLTCGRRKLIEQRLQAA